MNQYNIEQVIAHKAPMILISGLTTFSLSTAECWVDINEQSPFFRSSIMGVPNYIGIEYMAQSIAAFAGANALDKGEEIKIGFLLGMRKFTSYQPSFRCGARLVINIEQLHCENSGLSVFSSQISENNEILAEGKVNVFQPTELEKFVEEQA